MASPSNYISLVQEYTQKHGFQLPKYEDVMSYGADHQKQFVCRVSLPNTDSSYEFEADGSRKKEAKANAARLLYDKLQTCPPKTGNLPSTAKIMPRAHLPFHLTSPVAASGELAAARAPARQTRTLGNASFTSSSTTCEPDSGVDGCADFCELIAKYDRYLNRAFDRTVESSSDQAIPLSRLLCADRAPHSFVAFAKAWNVMCRFHDVAAMDSDDYQRLCLLFVEAGCRMERIVTNGCGATLADAFRQALLSALHQMDELRVTKAFQ